MVRFWWLKAIGGPGSPGFFVAVAAVGLILYTLSNTRRIGRRVLGGLLATYAVLSLPFVAHLVGGAPASARASDAASLAPVADVFVFDGDSQQMRARFAADLDRVLQPKTVWVLGFDEMRAALRESGIGEARIRMGYSAGSTTQGQMVQMAGLMKHYKIKRAVAITSRLQARRVRGMVTRAGLDVVVLGAPVDREPASSGAWLIVPSFAALAYSRDAIYERVAMVYYWSKGWI